MQIKIEIDATKLVARLDRMVPNVHAALNHVLGPLAQEVAADSRRIAADHIHTIGEYAGAYLASIYGGVADKSDTRIVGYVRSANPIAHILEHGAHVPAHEIMPTVADVLAWVGDAGMVFAKAVHSPGAVIPPYPAIEPAFTAAESRIEAELTRAVKGAL